MESIDNKYIMRYVKYFTIISLMLNIIVIFEVDDCKAAGSVIYVDDDFLLSHESEGTLAKPYTSIQHAINEAEEGDTVFVLDGSYSSFELNKAVTVKGQSITKTFISGNAQDKYLIDITAAYSTIENFRIWDTTLTTHRKAVIHVSSSASNVKIIGTVINESKKAYGLEIEGNNTLLEDNIISYTKGINLANSQVTTVFNNDIYGCGNNPAIRIFNSNNNHIERNNINNSKDGIYSINSENNKILNNTIFSNTETGIKIIDGYNDLIKNNTIYNNNLRGVDINSLECQIIKNTIYLSDIGINIGGNDGVIKNNTVNETSIYAINMQSGSNDNTIFNNTFKDKVSGSYSNEDGSNQWYDADLERGNYWKDFIGPNPNNDSTLDSLDASSFYYTKGGVLDKYPTGKYQEIPVISNPNPSHLASGVKLQPTLNVKVVDPDGGTMDVHFYYRKDNVSHFIDSVKNVKSGFNASIPFFSLEENKNAVYTYIGAGYDYICEWFVEVYDQYSKVTSPKYLYSTITSPLDNEKPIADVGGPYQTYETGEIISFDGSDSYDPDGSIAFYRWTFGDGESVVNVKTTTHSYSKEGEYEVTLTIIDNNGSSETDTAYIPVFLEKPNTPPVPIISVPFEGYTEDQVTFTSASTDKDGDSLSCTWKIENTSYSGMAVNHVFNEPGTYIVMLTVSDGESEVDSLISIEITVKPEETPGFEIIIFLVSLLLVTILIRKRNRSKF